MISIKIDIKIKKPKWFQKLFNCKHNVVIVEENFQSRYGTHTSYMMCLKCGRKAMEISQNCNHVLDYFGVCRYCLDRIEKNNCEHKKGWNQEPNTDDYWCEECGEFKDNEK